jgi:hypothetical protein
MSTCGGDLLIPTASTVLSWVRLAQGDVARALASGTGALLLVRENLGRALQTSASVGADVGPHMISGYGRSTWNQNVALVETTQPDIDRRYQAQVECDSGAGLDQPPPSEVAVDPDFQQALQRGAVNL